MKKFLSFIMFSLLLLSCEKKATRTISVEGIVYNYYSNTPVKFQKIFIEKCIVPLITGRSCSDFDSIESDENGYYSITKLINVKEGIDFDTYLIIASSSEKYASSSLNNILLDQKNDIDLYIKPLQNLTVYLNDTSNAFDKLKIRITDPNSSDSHEFKEITYYSKGKYSLIDSIDLKCIPDEINLISWELYSGNELIGIRSKKIYFEYDKIDNITINY